MTRGLYSYFKTRFKTSAHADGKITQKRIVGALYLTLSTIH